MWIVTLHEMNRGWDPAQQPTEKTGPKFTATASVEAITCPWRELFLYSPAIKVHIHVKQANWIP